MSAGFEEAQHNFRNDSVNRIVLLSDGLANVGIVDPSQIANEAKRIRENKISVSTMGVGLDYNENLMASSRITAAEIITTSIVKPVWPPYSKKN